MVAAALYLLWQRWELRQFKVTPYYLQSGKVSHPMRFAVLADLHAHVYGKENDVLLEAIRNQRPDAILIPGDLIVSKDLQTFEVAYRFLQNLVRIAPVYVSNGNHESRLSEAGCAYAGDFLEYVEKIQALGVRLLNNASVIATVNGEEIRISGLEIPLSCYGKGSYEDLPDGYLQEALGAADDGRLQILLAHNPMFAPAYASWGADLTVCGHNHGGLVRIPGIGSLLSPQLQLFPKYDAGEFTIDGRKVYVSKGLGTHTFHIRIFNRAEVLLVHVDS